MNPLVLLAAAAAEQGNPLQEVARTFGVDWPHLLAQMISFSIVALLLYKFAYKRVLAVLEERRQCIAEGLANAERIKEDLAKTELARQEVLDRANTEAARLIEEAHAAAARVQERETQKAIAAAEQIMVKAREAAALEHVRMFAEVKHELGRLVVQTTTTVTGRILTNEDQRRLAEETALQISA